MLKANQENKLLFVDMTATWCPVCKDQDRTALKDPQVAEFLASRYVSVRVDADSPTGQTMMRQYQIKGVPTLMVFEPSGKMRAKSSGGYKTGNDLIQCISTLTSGPQEFQTSFGQPTGQENTQPGQSAASAWPASPSDADQSPSSGTQPGAAQASGAYGQFQQGFQQWPATTNNQGQIQANPPINGTPQTFTGNGPQFAGGQDMRYSPSGQPMPAWQTQQTQQTQQYQPAAGVPGNAQPAKSTSQPRNWNQQ